MKQPRNDTLDLLKLFTSYMVVFIHIPFYGGFGDAVGAVARFAVPFFFVVSGFYSYGNTPDQIKRKALRILRLLVPAVIVYLLWDMLRLFLLHDVQDIAAYFIRFLEPQNLLKLFVLNVPIHAPHLWYLFAILYVYILFYFVTVHPIRERLIFTIAFLLLSLHLLLGEGLSLFSIKLPAPVIRNFLFLGIPAFGLGLFVHTYKHKLSAIPNSILILAVVLGAIEAVLSFRIFGRNELYIGSLLILFALIVIFLKYADAKYPPVLTSLTGCSTYIYIFHPIVSSVISVLYQMLSMDFSSSVILQMLHPLLVCVFSTVLSCILIRLLQRRKV